MSCTSRTTCLSVSRSAATPPFLRAIAPEQGTVADPAEPHPGFQQGDRAGVGARAAADLDLAPAGLAADGQERAFGEDLDPAGAVFRLVRVRNRARRFPSGAGRRRSRSPGSPGRAGPADPCRASPAWPEVRRRRWRLSVQGGRPCRRRMPASTVAIWRSRISSGWPSWR